MAGCFAGRRCDPFRAHPHGTAGGAAPHRAPLNARTLSFVATQPTVLIWGSIGLLLLLTKATVVGSFVCLAVAAVKATQLLGHEDLDDRLRMQEDKRQQGVHRKLRPSERSEVMAIDRYAQDLAQAGASDELVRSVRERAWKIVHACGRDDATEALRSFRQGLPPIIPPERDHEHNDSDLRASIERELHVLRATEQELGSL